MEKFIAYLDSIKSSNDMNYNQLLNLYNVIENNYNVYHPNNDMNQYYYPVYYNFQPGPYLQPGCLDLPSQINYTDHSFYLHNKNNNLDYLHPDNNKENDWNVIKPENVPQIRSNVNISANIENISDILKIINEHAYDINTDYNIDLLSLNMIHNELKQIDKMVGMTKMKKSITHQLLYFIQELHVGTVSDFKHTVISGPPGTGKTEIAKILGKMYSKLGILKNNIFKKVTRNDLIAGYLGQTAIKTKNIITDCLGGVLFIDEAYSLGNKEDGDIFSNECIDILCESLSDHKDDLMVIIAGYQEELKSKFFSINKGLESRFVWRFNIDDYTYKELKEIFSRKITDAGWVLDEGTELSDTWFQKNHKNFKNFGRDMELLLFYVKISHGKRIYGKDMNLRKKINTMDLEDGLKMFLENTSKNEPSEIYGLYV